MQAIEYFPLVRNGRAYLIELFREHISALDIIANSIAVREHSPLLFRETIMAMVPDIADQATAKHIKKIEEENIRVMEQAISRI